MIIRIEESNPSFESCNECIYSDSSEETCILRQCIHAVAQLKECYVPKQPTIEPQHDISKANFLCPICGAEMEVSVSEWEGEWKS